MPKSEYNVSIETNQYGDRTPWKQELSPAGVIGRKVFMYKGYYKLVSLVAVSIVLVGCLFGCLSGCNRQILDLTYEYDKAILSLPNGTVVEGAVESWRDYEGDQLQVKIDGVTYLVHSSNCVFMKEG